MYFLLQNGQKRTVLRKHNFATNIYSHNIYIILILQSLVIMSLYTFLLNRPSRLSLCKIRRTMIGWALMKPQILNGSAIKGGGGGGGLAIKKIIFFIFFFFFLIRQLFDLIHITLKFSVVYNNVLKLTSKIILIGQPFYKYR